MWWFFGSFSRSEGFMLEVTDGKALRGRCLISTDRWTSKSLFKLLVAVVCGWAQDKLHNSCGSSTPESCNSEPQMFQRFHFLLTWLSSVVSATVTLPAAGFTSGETSTSETTAACRRPAVCCHSVSTLKDLQQEHLFSKVCVFKVAVDNFCKWAGKLTLAVAQDL